MAKSTKITVQNYPRIQEGEYEGCLDDATLKPHTTKIPGENLKQIIHAAIENANRKSSREILSIPLHATSDEIDRIYEREGKELFRYFKKYVGDPAATAHQIYGKSYRDVGRELFRNRTLQKERMNSGWRYQFLSLECAQETGRFKSISGINASEGDFNAVIEFLDRSKSPLNIYVSVKNRSNTLVDHHNDV
jgi:hypothetical protein